MDRQLDQPLVVWMKKSLDQREKITFGSNGKDVYCFLLILEMKNILNTSCNIWCCPGHNVFFVIFGGLNLSESFLKTECVSRTDGDLIPD